ncbi:transaldolase family protein [Pelagibius sp. Alg239-R121]|uniref:transaldolase family protein n=1 Tax=Pelagibius sp. Alg239-R121 TaxID=2993448 RepID=UPI0024A7745B|nr:transaldolase family protein [Pelagibius sp. Alg239-R121]
MKLFIDSADRAVWKNLAHCGFFSGVTTNPLLLQRAGLTCNNRSVEELHRASIGEGFCEIQIQSWGETQDDLAETALRLADFGPEVVVKLPATSSGFCVARQLRLERPETRVTMTAVYVAGQVIAAAAFGAAYAAPYYARLREAGEDADKTLAQMRVAAGSQMQLLVASLRSVDQVVHLTSLGHRCFTLPPPVAEGLLQSVLADRAVAEFDAAAAL